MADDFKYDVFLSHSSKEKAVVRPLAERLRADGLRVWFEGCETKPWTTKGLQAKKVEEGLEHSRVLVLCMSANAFGADWAMLESQTFRFRDPLNKERRFIPLRLDKTPIIGFLAQLGYISLPSDDRDQEYARLLEACHPPAASAEPTGEQVSEKIIRLDYDQRIQVYAFSANGKRALSGAFDCTVRRGRRKDRFQPVCP